MTDARERVKRLQELLALVRPVPADWLVGKGSAREHGKELEPLGCKDWDVLLKAWRKAIRLRQGLEDVLAVMLAVCLSTEQVGDSQLFLMVIGVPGNAKTRLCDALLVSKKCCPLEHLKGFYSGYTDATGEDFSLLARINRKTLITPEMDVMMGDPNFVKLMSEARRIFDGTGGASYKNKKEDLRYTGLRTPWIAAGTPALLDNDQSRLGDRFLKIYVDRPDYDEQRSILLRAGYTELASVVQTSNGHAEGQMTAELARAYQLTGGYVDYLRSNAGELLSAVQQDAEYVVDRCATLAEFAALLRARPNSDLRKQEGEVVVELPSRLTKQFVRLAKCLAVVLCKRDRNLLTFLRHPHVGAVRQMIAPVKVGLAPRVHWTLSEKMRKLYETVTAG